MKSNKLLSNYKLGQIELQNRVVMAPLTRSRAIGNIPNDLMAEYYKQRSGAGLIITEGTSPSLNGLGYSRIPGVFSKEQVEGWKKITSAVHNQGSKIFNQLMHTGRISHALNLPDGARVLAPSAVKPAGQMWTDSKQLQDYPIPEEMSAKDIQEAKAEYVKASMNSIKAGFDGVELHSANGYLLEQFLSPHSNTRTDSYGGSVENRCRFVLEVASEVAHAIGKEKTGIRLSPFGVASDMAPYSEIPETYEHLSKELNKIGLTYIHLVDHSSLGAPEVPLDLKKLIRSNFKNTIIMTGGYDQERAESDLQNDLADLIGFGRSFINNPDLVERFKNEWPLSQNLDPNLFYSPGEKGYTDYPKYNG